MLKITRKVEYALIALRHLQQNKNSTLSSSKEIAEKYDIPKELLAKILQNLVKNKVLTSTKGPNGGYKIATDPSKVNMTNFFEFIEGPFGIIDCHLDSGCEKQRKCTIKAPLDKINDSIRSVFDNMTLEEITV
jgi:Rrf2 family protein